MPTVIQTGFFKGTRIPGRSRYASQLETIQQRLKESEGALEKHAQATVLAATAFLQQLPNSLATPASLDANHMAHLEDIQKRDEEMLNAFYRAVMAQFSYLTNDNAKDIALHLRMAMAERQANPLAIFNLNHCKRVMRGDIKKQVAARARFMVNLMTIATFTICMLSLASLFLWAVPLAMCTALIASYAVAFSASIITRLYRSNMPSKIQAAVLKKIGPELDALQTLLGSILSQAENIVELKAFEAEANTPSTVMAAPL